MKLSVIIPLYNSSRWMRRCLDSLLEQDIPKTDYELICINDGSEDDSEAIAREYAKEHNCVKVLSQANGGVSAARNAGIRAAKGEYLCFVDPDDYVKPNSLKIVLQRMDNGKLDMLRFGYEMVDENYQPCMPYKHYDKPDLTQGLTSGRDYLCSRLGYSCFIWTYIYRTAIIKDNDLYCSEGVYFDDTDWLPKVLMVAKRFDCIDMVRHYYLIRANSLVNQTNDERKKRQRLNGSLQIMKILYEDRFKCADEGVRQWYMQMINTHALSALTSVAVDFFEERSLWIKRMEEYDAFRVEKPLSKQMECNKLKYTIMGLSPELFCLMVRAKNR